MSINISDAFRLAVAELTDDDWASVDYKGRQWAEVCFAADGLGTTKSGPHYRFIAVREPLRQLDLPGVEPAELPFLTHANGANRYKLHAIVTNRDIDGAKLVRWHHERCGDSEAAHSVMKSDLAGGHMQSAVSVRSTPSLRGWRHGGNGGCLASSTRAGARTDQVAAPRGRATLGVGVSSSGARASRAERQVSSGCG